MGEWIEKLDEWLRQNRSEYYAQLRPGLSPDELRQLESELGVSLPDGLAALLQWRNGQSADCYSSFYYNSQLMGAPEILSARETLNELVECGDQAESWWSPTWVPFLDNGGGAHHCVETAPGENAGNVIEFWHDLDERPVAFPSIDSWGTLFAESLEAGLWLVDNDGEIHAREEGNVDLFDRFVKDRLRARE